MIIKAFIDRVRTLLEDELGNPGPPSFAIGPAPPPSQGLPRVVISAGKMEVPAPFGDAPPGQVRPRGLKESPFTVNLANVEGPYTLSQQPLEGTISCRLAWLQPNDSLEGKKTRLYPRKGNTGDGFTVNYAVPEIRVFHAGALSGAPKLEVEYTYPAIYSIREFRQAMLLESYADTPANAEKWAALAASVLISNTDALLQDTNSSGNFHSEGNYVTEHLLSEFQLAEGMLDRIADDQFRYTLQFRTAGQVILVHSITGDFGIINTIYSPGGLKEAGSVNIEANLD